MPYITKRENGHNSQGKKTKYVVIAKDTGKRYHTNNPEKLKKLHESYSHNKQER